MKPADCLLRVLVMGLALAQAQDGEDKCSTSQPVTGRGVGEGQLIEGSSACGGDDEWKLGDPAQPLYRYQRCDSPSGAVFI